MLNRTRVARTGPRLLPEEQAADPRTGRLTLPAFVNPRNPVHRIGIEFSLPGLSQMLDVAIFNRLRRQAWWRAPLVASVAASVIDNLGVSC